MPIRTPARRGATLLAAIFIGATTPGAAAADDALAAADLNLERVSHNPHVLPDREHAGFGALLYSASGKLVLHGGDKTWLYTTGLYEAPTGGRRDWYGKWISHVREFDSRTLASGEKKLALGLADSDQWAVIHDVIEVSGTLYVAFYSTNGGVRAAISDKPDGPFTAVANFKIGVTDAWEKAGGNSASLESNGAHVLVEESARDLTLWLGYDSYHVDQTAGQLGWAKVRIDKLARGVELVEKHPGNPLPLLPKNYIAARCGGNLAADTRLMNQYAFFFYTRPTRQKLMLSLALSTDPLFQSATRIVELEAPAGGEKVIEKFESYMVGDELHIIYENNLDSGHWGTGMLIYRTQLGSPRRPSTN
jgi:hypothetical protein